MKVEVVMTVVGTFAAVVSCVLAYMQYLDRRRLSNMEAYVKTQIACMQELVAVSIAGGRGGGGGIGPYAGGGGGGGGPGARGGDGGSVVVDR